MDSEYSYQFTKPAVSDLDSTLHYIANELNNPIAAQNLGQNILPPSTKWQMPHFLMPPPEPTREFPPKRLLLKFTKHSGISTATTKDIDKNQKSRQMAGFFYFPILLIINSATSFGFIPSTHANSSKRSFSALCIVVSSLLRSFLPLRESSFLCI